MIITRFVVTALALAAPVLALAQTATSQGATGLSPAQTTSSSQSSPAVAPVQALPGLSTPGATLPGGGLSGLLPNETAQLGQAPANQTLYGIAAGVGETDNVNLSQTDPKSQTVAATDLDFDLRRTGPGFDAYGLGNFTDLDYLQGAYSNQVLGRFDGLADAKFWSDRLKWTVGDDYGEEQTDPFAAITPVNLERVNLFTTGPDVMLHPSDATFVALDARYSNMTYQTSPFDGHNLLGSAEVGRLLSPLSALSLVVQAEELRFQNTTVNTDYDRRAAYAHYLIQGARTSIDAQLGATQTDDVEASWKSSPLVRLALTRRISPFSIATLTGGREYTDASGSFGNLSSGAGGGIVVAPVTQTTANYLRNYGTAGVDFARLRTTVGFTGSWERDTYDNVESLYDVTRAAVGVNVARNLTPQLSASLSGSVDRYDYFNQNFTNDFGTLGAGLAYRPGRWFIVYARYDHSLSRSSGAPVGVPFLGGVSYDENRVFVMVGYRPHSEDMEAGGSPESGGAAAP